MVEWNRRIGEKGIQDCKDLEKETLKVGEKMRRVVEDQRQATTKQQQATAVTQKGHMQMSRSLRSLPVTRMHYLA